MPLLVGQDGVAVGVVVFLPHDEHTVPVACVTRGNRIRTYIVPWRLLAPTTRPKHFALKVDPDDLWSYGLQELEGEIVLECLPTMPLNFWLN